MRKAAFCLLLLALIAAGAPGNRAAADDTAGKKKELQRIKREMLQKKKDLKRAGRKERSILTALDGIDREILAEKKEVAEQRQRLQDAETTLRDVEKNNAELSRSLSELKKAYALRIRALYMAGRTGYTAALFASDGPGDALKRITYLGIITERDRSLMEQYRSALDRLTSEQAGILQQQESILERKRTLEAKKAELEARKKEKASLLAGVRDKKVLYKQALRELEESSQSLWGMIRRAEEESRSARPAVSVPPPSGAADMVKNRLPWPAEGPVITRFGMQRHPQFGIQVFRRGIEIAVHEGEAVRSAGAGEVAYADWYKGYGNLVIIEHGPAFYTLYGNLSRLDVRKGDRVAAGQVIGLAGDTGSLKGAKLYFEIRRNGEAQDPLAWLAKR